MRRDSNFQRQATGEGPLFGVIAASLTLHALLFGVLAFAPDFLSWGEKDKPFDVITIRLVGAVEPPAPAAPKAPVNPDLDVPDVVRLPEAEPMLPQPTPLDRIIIPETPPEAIPIGITPAIPVPQVQKTPEPPPKVPVPEKPPDPTPKPKPKPAAPSTDTQINTRIQELQRKKDRQDDDDLINQSIANLAAERGRDNGLSSEPAAANTTGQLIDDPVVRDYYRQLMEIVRANWMPPSSPINNNISSTFVIVIDPSGRVTGKALRISSGNSDFDLSVEQAIVRSKFPPLPAVFNGRPDNPALQFNLGYLRALG
ncbi:MAG: TonB C-terminal domain-containing protein [Deltaproteobacteria bacterium]|jgi:outer membrane biosynthesis protein TonB|nr:TonB C-terminal domain-containing protein [Deltaproteobacteria bacterium]